MPPPVPEQLSKTIETLYRSESGRVLATLVRLLEDLDLAEEAMHEAFAAALESWPKTGIPEKPRPWLISTARFKAIDVIRRRARFDERTQRDLALHMEARISETPLDGEEIEDDRLRLIFTCCHPALPPEGQVALTLREICGLATEEIDLVRPDGTITAVRVCPANARALERGEAPAVSTVHVGGRGIPWPAAPTWYGAPGWTLEDLPGTEYQGREIWGRDMPRRDVPAWRARDRGGAISRQAPRCDRAFRPPYAPRAVQDRNTESDH